MDKLSLNKLREKFLEFFERKNHLTVPSFSLVPEDDPSILLINAGMTPLKPYFTGAKKPPSPKMATCQKCIRVIDIERVGLTSRHGTFFEMLGNFSFGDYFKKEAIKWAWEFFVEELKIPVEKLFVSVYEEDQEAYDIWKNEMGLGENKIFKLGKDDNFWEHGTGPCGPCSEIYFDRGEDKGCKLPGCTVGCDCDRYVEVWNLVFTQFNKQEDGSYIPLDKKNIDTGMGLERLACVMQGVDSLFEVDTIKAILNEVCKKAGMEYKTDNKADISIRIITDHIRSTVMMISDGIIPSNEGRGYVLRRLLRRAARHGRLLGIKGNFLSELSETVINESNKAYPELLEKKEYIRKILKTEEERFSITIEQGLLILKEYLEQITDGNMLSGDKIFKLHDTYGFPYELTEEIAKENSIILDRQGYEKEMTRQREMARKAQKAEDGASAWDREKNETYEDLPKTEFIGYDFEESFGKVLHVETDNNDSVKIIIDKTPFYAEGGGQISDTGKIFNDDFEMTVNNCLKTDEGVYVHTGKIVKGSINKGAVVTALIDVERRNDIRKNHTVTHILQYALRQVLGTHVAQAGSYVSSERLRFDFNHYTSLSDKEIDDIQDIVNKRILDSIPVNAEEMSYASAKEKGATALFNEKYGDNVRVISIDGYSVELCGGTHLSNTSQAGIFKIVSESGVSAGVRRIEAVTGYIAYRYYEDRSRMLNEVSKDVKAQTPEQVSVKVKNLLLELKESRKEIETLKTSRLSVSAEDMDDLEVLNNTNVIVKRIDNLDVSAMRGLMDKIREKHDDSVVVLASSDNGNVLFTAAATKLAVAKGIHSGNILKEAARIAGGGGGGRPDMAQAGGKDASKIDEALEASKKIIKEVLLK